MASSAECRGIVRIVRRDRAGGPDVRREKGFGCPVLGLGGRVVDFCPIILRRLSLNRLERAVRFVSHPPEPFIPLRSHPLPDSSIPCIFPQAIQTFALTTFS